MTPQVFLEDARQRVDNALEAALPASDEAPEGLHQAMRYSVLGGGKRIRPALVLATNRALKGDGESAMPAALAVELIHAYSLVHDDLPSMDDDDLRRGQPTCHRAFDEATAILAGDALQALAFQLLSEPSTHASVQQLRMIRILSEAAGHSGMVGGQALDLAATGEQLTVYDLERMHRRKTGALIEASVMLGALAADCRNENTLAAVHSYGGAIGLAFQVKDDLLDDEGKTEIMGKPQGSDLGSNKPTYTSLLGRERARHMLQELHRQALTSLNAIPGEPELLHDLAEFVIQRDH